MGRRAAREFVLPFVLLSLFCAQGTKGQSGPLHVCRSSTGGRVEPCADPPQPLDMVYPNYAPLPITPSGEIEFSLVINQEGIPQSIQLVKSAGDLLDGPAAEALNRCKFKPGIDKGQVVAVELKMYLHFGCSGRAMLWPEKDSITNYTITQKTRGHARLTKMMRDCGPNVSGREKGVCAPLLLSRVGPAGVDPNSELAKLRGTIVLSVEIGSNGVVRDAVALRSAGKDLDNLAITAVTQSRYRPALYKGQPIPVRAIIEFSFWFCSSSPMYWGYEY